MMNLNHESIFSSQTFHRIIQLFSLDQFWLDLCLYIGWLLNLES